MCDQELQAKLDKAIEIAEDLLDYAYELIGEWGWKKGGVAGNAEQYDELDATIKKSREVLKTLKAIGESE